MIAFDFSFLQPKTILEARNEYEKYTKENKQAFYYSGGTEFISRARANEVSADVVIDLKNIPECLVYEIKDNQLYIGAAITLNTITDQIIFPLLSEVVKNIATRTARNKITLGGNLCSNLPYKEALLPFLLTESKISVATKNGIEIKPITEIFHLSADEILIQVITDIEKFKSATFYEKRTKQAKINYPIITTTAMTIDHQLRIAITGLAEKPIHFSINQNENLITIFEQKILTPLQGQIIDDDLASNAYRLFVCQTMLNEILAEGIGKL